MNKTVRKNEFWRLTIHWYPDAAKAGVRPYDGRGVIDRDAPGAYWPRDFDFVFPPTRHNFMEVCKRFLPWTMTWQKDLFPIIEQEKCDWPMIDYGHKGATVKIKDENGLEIGRLEVWKHNLFVNEGEQEAPFIGVDIINRAVRGYHGQRRLDLVIYLEAQKYRMLENLANLSRTEERPIEQTDIDQEIHKSVLRWRAIQKKVSKVTVQVGEQSCLDVS